MPVSSDPDLNGFSGDYWDISMAGDTTMHRTIDYRGMVAARLFQRGAPRKNAFSERLGVPRVLFFVPSEESAAELERVFKEAAPALEGCAVMAVVAGVSPAEGLSHGTFPVVLAGTRADVSFVDCFLDQRGEGVTGLLTKTVWASKASHCADALSLLWKPELAVVMWGETAQHNAVAMHAALALKEGGAKIAVVGNAPQNSRANVIGALTSHECLVGTSPSSFGACLKSSLCPTGRTVL
jgi:hypothetical protein